ncbi:methyltransferase [Campylobacter sp. 19-13652]|nr:methyltransferase [Campylobacter sp. 19-13652]
MGLSDLAKSNAQSNPCLNDVKSFSAAASPSSQHISDKSSLENATPISVLELGCSFGGNLISYALHDPSATLHGIDLSLSQISEGRRIAKFCGASNLVLEHLDITDFSAVHANSKYDYIIAHGVYSWVPAHVREAILSLIARHLAPFGMAYISFNALPGWHARMPLRRLMLAAYEQHSNISFVKQTLDIYRHYLLTRHPNSVQIALIDRIKEASDHYIRHEWLSEVNDAFYFDEFSASLAHHELGYLCEADLSDILSPDLAYKQADDFIRAHFSSHVASELMLDIFSDRTFRRSLITHASNIKALANKDIGVADISKLHICSILTKTENGYVDNMQRRLDAEYGWLYDLAGQVSPASISLPQVLALFSDTSHRLQAYAGFIKMLEAVTEGIKVDINPRNAIKYEPYKTRINPRYEGYLKYFASTNEPFIDFADAFNYVVSITKKEAEILLRFDGKATKAQIVGQIASEFGASRAKANQYLDELERLASSMYLFEEL